MLRSDPDVWHMGAHLLDWAFAQHGGAEPVGRLDGTPAPDTTSVGQAPASPPATASTRCRPLSPRWSPARCGRPSQALPDGQRTALLLAVLALALVGGAMVRRLASPARRPARAARLRHEGQAPDAGEARPHHRNQVHGEAHDVAGPEHRAPPALSGGSSSL